MSDTQQQHTDVGGNAQQQAQSAPSPQPVTNQPAAQSVVSSAPPLSVGGVSKEQAPVALATEHLMPADHVEITPQLAPEVAEAGVEHVPSAEQPRLSADAIKAGLAVSPSHQPVSQATGQTVTFPGEMNEQKAEQVRKTSSWKDSFLWLVEEWWREKKKLKEKALENK